MNKKAQSIDLDPNNPISWVFYIIGLFIVVSIAISILSVVNQVAFDSMCNDVVVERDGYKADAEFWESQYNSLNQSIAECDEKVRLIEKSCNNKIANATEQCEKNLNYYITLLPQIKKVYVISIAIWVFLSFSLFKSLFKIEISFGDTLDEWVERYETLVKVFGWIIFGILFLVNIIFLLLVLFM
jgi:hypothetical protein